MTEIVRMDEKPPTLDQLKELIARLPRADRASLRPWLLAKFDAQGYEQKRLNSDQDEPRRPR